MLTHVFVTPNGSLLDPDGVATVGDGAASQLGISASSAARSLDLGLLDVVEVEDMV